MMKEWLRKSCFYLLFAFFIFFIFASSFRHLLIINKVKFFKILTDSIMNHWWGDQPPLVTMILLVPASWRTSKPRHWLSSFSPVVDQHSLVWAFNTCPFRGAPLASSAVLRGLLPAVPQVPFPLSKQYSLGWQPPSTLSAAAGCYTSSWSPPAPSGWCPWTRWRPAADILE